MSDSRPLDLPKEVIRQLSTRSDFKGMLQLLSHLFLLFLTTVWISGSFDSIFVYPALLVHGIVLIFLFCPLHETIHFTAFKNKQLNNEVAAILGFLLLLPYQHFRAFHTAHHRFTQDPERDPELAGPRPENRKAYFLAMTGYAVWKGCTLGLWKHAMGDVDAAFIEERKHALIVLEARCYVGLYGLLVLGSILTANSTIWWYWVLPALLGQPVLRLFLIAEHFGCDESTNMLKNSRTTYTGPVVNFLSWNMAYHAEHHYLASIPFHALPALHAYTGSQVKHRDDGYLNVNRKILDQLE